MIAGSAASDPDRPLEAQDGLPGSVASRSPTRSW